MNLFTFNSKLLKTPIGRSLITALTLLSSYHILVVTKVITPSKGMHQWQNNFIKIQSYAYQNQLNGSMVIVGSSLTANLQIDTEPQIINLGISGGCTQTGTESVKRNPSKPAILLVEINETINRKIDSQLIDSIYNPFLYPIRRYIPMLKEEYHPVAVVIPTLVSIKQRLREARGLKNKPRTIRQVVNVPQTLTDKLISQAVEEYKSPVAAKEESLLRQEAEYIKAQISQIRKDGVRVVLFDIPREQRIQATLRERQIRSLMREFFPSKDFEWLPEPPPRNWKTNDGFHLVSSDATEYYTFLKNQILNQNNRPISELKPSQPALKPN